MKQDYLVLIDREFVRNAQAASVPETDTESDDWIDIKGDLSLGIYSAETKDKAISLAAVHHHVAGDVLVAFELK